MSCNFKDAAHRHYDDGVILHTAERLANADHLFGLSAECALKAVMQGIGMRIRSDGAPEDKAHRVHINALWDEFIVFSSTRNSTYGTMMTTSNPFNDWNISQRYHCQSIFIQSTVDAHKKAATDVKGILKRAIIDGVVP